MRRFLSKFMIAFLMAAVLAMPAVSQSVSSAPTTALATEAPPEQYQPSPASFDAVADQIAASELRFLENMRSYSPLTETYIQNMKPDPDLGQRPASDAYFIGKLQLSATSAKDQSLLPARGPFRTALDKLTMIYDLKYLPLGFAQMTMPDNGGLNRQNYDFKFVRREFLGDVRCLVVDVTPKKHSGSGRFLGRIWVEDQDYNIVRFNGTYVPAPKLSVYLHFDSWRLNMKPGLWLPAYIYSEESDVKYGFGMKDLKFKAQTRLWGYEGHSANNSSDFTEMLVDSVKDQSDNAGHDLSPVESQRVWEHQAEENILERLTRTGLLAQPGEVEKVLQTVVNNIQVTNNLDIQPPVRCRIVLTAPLESFTVGHTIVLSRGLIDVLPDEATLAAVLARELAHITLGHKLDTKYGFMDRLLFSDETVYRKLKFQQRPADEIAADQKAIALLRNSPYGDKLASVGLFLKALEARQQELPNLIRARLGNSMAGQNGVRMIELGTGAPQLEVRKLDQIAALPLGGRLRVDPYTGRAELVKNKPVPLFSPAEKMSFEVTPVYPFVTRINAGTSVASAVSGK